MQTIVTTKITPVLGFLNNDSKTQDQLALRVLTNEEILAVAGGPEVDIETGTGGG